MFQTKLNLFLFLFVIIDLSEALRCYTCKSGKAARTRAGSKDRQRICMSSSSKILTSDLISEDCPDDQPNDDPSCSMMGGNRRGKWIFQVGCRYVKKINGGGAHKATCIRRGLMYEHKCYTDGCNDKDVVIEHKKDSTKQEAYKIDKQVLVKYREDEKKKVADDAKLKQKLRQIGETLMKDANIKTIQAAHQRSQAPSDEEIVKTIKENLGKEKIEIDVKTLEVVMNPTNKTSGDDESNLPEKGERNAKTGGMNKKEKVKNDQVDRRNDNTNDTHVDVSGSKLEKPPTANTKQRNKTNGDEHQQLAVEKQIIKPKTKIEQRPNDAKQEHEIEKVKSVHESPHFEVTGDLMKEWNTLYRNKVSWSNFLKHKLNTTRISKPPPR